MILSDVITDVRRLTQDETTTYRYSDAFLLALCNQVLKRIALLRPDLFAFFGTVTCVTGAVVQTAPSESLRVIEVYSVVGGTGNGVTEVNREVLDRTLPGWRTDTAAEATNWMRHVRNPNSFFIYPKSPAAQVLEVEYSQVPTTYSSSATVTLLPDAFFPTVVDGVVWLVESVDNENVTSGRAKMFQDSFIQSLGLSTKGRTITDTETSGLADDEVI